MSLLRPISIFLRNALVKQHPFFSCCASCGEIATPIDMRLCTSLAADFDVDAVVLSKEQNLENHPEQYNALTQALRESMPWLRNIFIFPDCLPDNIQTLQEEAHFKVDTALSPAVPLLEIGRFVHTIPGLAEQYLIVQPTVALPSSRLRILDFFTPNAIPLLPVGSVHPDSCAGDPAHGRDRHILCLSARNTLLAQTKETATDFFQACRKGAHSYDSDAGYFTNQVRWAYLSGKAILAACCPE